MKQLLPAGLLALTLAACQSQPAAPVAAPTPAIDTTKTYPVALLDNKKDPVCGMPAAAGLTDTIHLNGKVIGFCSQDCKNDFLKNPAKYPVEYK